MQISKKQHRYFELAANVAWQSDHPSYRVGAVLVKSGRIINTSCNKIQWNSFASRFSRLRVRKNNRRMEPENASVHAEIGTILGLPKSLTQNSDIYVLRIKANGDRAMAKPCGMCQGVLAAVGVNRVFYTTSETEIEKMVIK